MERELTQINHRQISRSLFLLFKFNDAKTFTENGLLFLLFYFILHDLYIIPSPYVQIQNNKDES